MIFWIVAAIMLLTAGLLVALPMFKNKLLGVVLLLIFPAAGLMIYQAVGTPEGLDPPETPAFSAETDVDTLIASVEARLAEEPGDVDGWLLLGRTYKSLKRHSDAEAALSNAYKLTPDNPLVMVELAEARLFASGNPEIAASELTLLQQALDIDPEQQKALWLLGIAAAQREDNDQAITYWQRLMALLEPGSTIAASVQQQIQRIQAADSDFRVPVSVNFSDAASTELPAEAVLFVFARLPNAQGMPLAVQRVQSPRFPVQIELNGQHLLQPGNTPATDQPLMISAKLSMTGTANPDPSDLVADAVSFTPDSGSVVVLDLRISN